MHKVATPPTNHDTLHPPAHTHHLSTSPMQTNSIIAATVTAHQIKTAMPRVNVASEAPLPAEPRDIILDIRRTTACWVRLVVLLWATSWKIN